MNLSRIFILLGAIASSALACINEYTPNHKAQAEAKSFIDTLTKADIAEPWAARAERLAKVAAASPDFKIRNDLAVALMHIGKPAESISILEALEKAKPGLYRTATNLGTAYELAGQPEKAVEWIKNGIERNSNSHEGSEWIHVRVLEAKLALAKDPAWLESNSVLGMDFGVRQIPTLPEQLPLGNSGAKLTLEQIVASLKVQLHERLQFVKSPDPIVASLLFDLANLLSLKGTQDTATHVFRLAADFAAKGPQTVKTAINLRASGAGVRSSDIANRRGLAAIGFMQNKDGSFGEKHSPTLTAMALIAFLSHGETTDSPNFGATVQACIEWLINCSAKNDGWLSGQKGETAESKIEHAICAHALGEYYSMTKDDRAIAPITKAVAIIVKDSTPTNQWTMESVRLGGFQTLALKSAELTELHLPGVQEKLSSINSSDELLRLNEWNSSAPGKTPMASKILPIRIFSHLHWKAERSDLRVLMESLLSANTSHPMKYSDPDADMETWLWTTHACLYFGGASWQFWNRAFYSEITGTVGQDGLWSKPVGKSGLQAEETRDGTIYRTIIAVSMLNVIYRYLPIHK